MTECKLFFHPCLTPPATKQKRKVFSWVAQPSKQSEDAVSSTLTDFRTVAAHHTKMIFFGL